MGVYVFKGVEDLTRTYGKPIEVRGQGDVMVVEPAGESQVLRSGQVAVKGQHVVVHPYEDPMGSYLMTKSELLRFRERIGESFVFRLCFRYVQVPLGDRVTLVGDGDAVTVCYPDCIGVDRDGRLFRMCRLLLERQLQKV